MIRKPSWFASFTMFSGLTGSLAGWQDPCCFRGQGRHPEIATYNTAVQATLAKAQGGWMQTAITAGDFHEVNYRDKVIVSSLTDLLRREGRLAKADLARIPMDLLRQQG